MPIAGSVAGILHVVARGQRSHGWARRGLLAGVAFLPFLAVAPLARGQAPTPPPPQLVLSGLARAPQYTMNVHGRQGDPVNIAFVGSEEELHRALALAHWFPADPITLKTSARLVADILERKPYPNAPVSNLYLWGAQDLSLRAAGG